MGLESLSLTSKKTAQGQGLPEASALTGQSSAEQTGSQSSQTLAGDLIGAVRDLSIFGGAPKTAAGKDNQAKSNDQIAEIAADTVLGHSGVNTWVGGLVRATMLVDPNKSLTDNAGTFALNFAEGAAFNKVSKMMLPGSS